MIDLANIEKYRENNRIEAKKALGGLPKSLWETYSAFANTLGGIILLGVEEWRDHSLHPIDLPDPQALIGEFWEIIDNPRKVSANILTRDNVRVERMEAGRIIVIEVPRAHRHARPVYLEGNPYTGTYRRSGEGDYRCSAQEVQSMLRDAATTTPDMELVAGLGVDALDPATLERYRRRIRWTRLGYPKEQLDENELLRKLGVLDFVTQQGLNVPRRLCPTVAGLLMFGRTEYIHEVFGNLRFEYREVGPEGVESIPGGEDKNLYDFYRFVYRRLLRISEQWGCDGASVLKALEEGLVNCLVNADYYAAGGPVVIVKHDRVIFSNPGTFRSDGIVDCDTAAPGKDLKASDPRCALIMRMFNLIGVGEGLGTGILDIYRTWRNKGWLMPSIKERFDPEIVTLTLPFTSADSPKLPAARPTRKTLSPRIKKRLIIEYLTDTAGSAISEIATFAGLDLSKTTELLEELVRDGVVVRRGDPTDSDPVFALKG